MRRLLILSRLTLVIATLAVATCIGANPALAGQGAQGYGTVSNGTITAGASSADSGSNSSSAAPSSGTGSSSAAAACQYVPAPPYVAPYLGPGPTPQGQWYVDSCALPVAMSGSYPPEWVPSGPSSPSSQSVPALLQQAIGQAHLIDPVINLNPPGQQVVNLPSWLWIAPGDWSGVTARAAAGGVNAVVTATPISVVWNLGDGATITCPGPGVPYNPALPASAQSTYCSYIWRTSSAGQPQDVYIVTATIEYQVTTVVAGAPDPTPNLGVHAGPVAQVAVQVSEIEALGTSP
jgi:hypothetical protein